MHKISFQTVHPPWLKKRLISNENLFKVKRLLNEASQKTVCEESLCPNLNECFSRNAATFLLLGDKCTRACGFCSVRKSKADAVDTSTSLSINGQHSRTIDLNEPARILDIVKKLGLEYLIVTSVTRDDLIDGGASQFAAVIGKVRGYSEAIKIEVLVPDFNGNRDSIKVVTRANPDVLAHNIETVKRLYPDVRRASNYDRSLDLLSHVKLINRKQLTKSSLMLGLGERKEEVSAAMMDLRAVGCDILTIGQYLMPTPGNLPVVRFVTLEEFEEYKVFGDRIGFKFVMSGPFVRSSYFGESVYNKLAEESYG